MTPPIRWNCAVASHGAWAGRLYWFMQRLRSGMPENLGEGFDSRFARLDRAARGRFDINWMPHTGRWRPLCAGVSLRETFDILREDEFLHPLPS